MKAKLESCITALVLEVIFQKDTREIRTRESKKFLAQNVFVKMERKYE